MVCVTASPGQKRDGILQERCVGIPGQCIDYRDKDYKTYIQEDGYPTTNPEIKSAHDAFFGRILSRLLASDLAPLNFRELTEMAPSPTTVATNPRVLPIPSWMLGRSYREASRPLFHNY
jgi:hypothetical protein